MSQLDAPMSPLYYSHEARRSLDLAKFFCEPARRNDYDMRQAEVDFIKASARLGKVYFYEDIQRWAPGDMAGKMIEWLEQDDFDFCKKRTRRCRKHEKLMQKPKKPIDDDFWKVKVEDVLAATGATFRDFEVRHTPDDDVASHRARLRATEYARMGLVEKGFALAGACDDYNYVSRPPGHVGIRLPPPFNDSDFIASSIPLDAIVKSVSPEDEVAKRLRCVEDTLAIARNKLIGNNATIDDLKQSLADKTMLLDEQVKEHQKTQKELAELSDSVRRAISGMDQLHPQRSATTGQCERSALHRQLTQRVGAMLRQVENGAKNAKRLDAATQKLRATEQDLQENRKEMETLKTENAILTGKVDDLKATNAILEARVAELRESNAQLDNLERLVECVVCKDRHVEVVFHCGHTTCSPCGERLDLNDEPCPSCQQKLGYRKKLFLGS